MRWPRIHLKMRSLMIAVALVALLLAAAKARQRYSECIRAAAYHRSCAEQHSESLKLDERSQQFSKKLYDFALKQLTDRNQPNEQPTAETDSDITEFLETFLNFTKTRSHWEQIASATQTRMAGEARKLAKYRALAEYELKLSQKYERAASRPWVTLAPDPPPPDPQYALAFWMKERDFARALAQADAAIRLDPKDADSLNSKAWILATWPESKLRDGAKAVAAATRACELTEWKNSAYLDSLAAAYAETGDFTRAVGWQERAVDAVPTNHPDYSSMRERLEQFRRNKPYRDLGQSEAEPR